MLFDRQFSIVWTELKWLYGASNEQIKTYYKWCADNPNKSPWSCPILMEMPWAKIEVKNPLLAIIKNEKS